MSEPSLEYFIAIAEELNISQAAKKLMISQQSLSTYLQKLESYYGTQLLTRKPSMALTEAGSIVYNAGCRIQKIHQTVKREVTELITPKNNLSIGIYMPNASLLMDFIPLVEFGKKYPEIGYHVTEDLNGNLRNMLSEGKLDLIISAYHPDIEFPDFEVRKLYTNTDYIIISDDLLQHYFPDDYPDNINKFSEGVRLADFAHVPVLLPAAETGFTKRLHRHCQQHDIHLNIAGEISNRYLSNSMIFDNIAWGFSDRRYLTYMQNTTQIKFLRGLHSFPIVDPPISNDVGVMYRKRDSYPQYFLELVDMIIEKNAYLA